MCLRQKIYDGVPPAKNSHYCKIKFKKEKEKTTTTTLMEGLIFSFPIMF
jgi:hypothetical protein